MREWLRFCLVGIASTVPLGCSVLIDVDSPQCDVDADCADLMLGGRCERHVCVVDAAACTGEDCDTPSDPTNLACGSDVECGGAAPVCMHGSCVPSTIAERFMCEEPEPSDPPQTVSYGFRVVEFVSQAPPGNVVARACRNNDVQCDSPVATFTDAEGTGMVQLQLPYGFTGYFDVTSDALHALSYLTKPINQDTQDRDLQVASSSTLDVLASVAGYPFEPDKGVVLIEAFDCSRSPAGGVHFVESKGTSHPFYFVNHLPNAEAQETVYDAENDVADGGFLNIDPGFITFSASFGKDGPKLGEFNAAVRASTITYIDMFF